MLDEAQDYTAEEIRLFRGLTEVLVATADQRQRIYDVQDSSAVLKDCVDTVHELKYHFRNGLEICRLADGLHKGSPAMCRCSSTRTMRKRPTRQRC